MNNLLSIFFILALPGIAPPKKPPIDIPAIQVVALAQSTVHLFLVQYTPFP